MPSSSLIWRIRAASSRFSTGLVPAAGSSSRMTPGSVPERAGDLQAPLLAVGQRAGQLVGAVASARRGRAARRPSAVASRSSRRCQGRPSIAATARTSAGSRRPTLTFSSAVSAGNSRMFWNVRATPRWLTTWVFLPSTLTAARRPARAATQDRALLRRVDAGEGVEQRGLAGAVRADDARISPRCICSETSFRLVTPPKRRVTSWTSKTRSSPRPCDARCVAGRSSPVTPLRRPERPGRLPDGRCRPGQSGQLGLAPSGRDQALPAGRSS